MIKYVIAIGMIFLMSCTQKEPTNEEIEKAFLEVNNEDLWVELQKMYDNDQYYRKSVCNLDQTSSNFEKKQDSLWGLQKDIDHKNSERLIEVTEKYGFPYPDRLGKPIAAWIIFQHSPEKYHQKIKSLLEREHQANRIGEVEYEMIKWHLGGRKGGPFEIIQ